MQYQRKLCKVRCLASLKDHESRATCIILWRCHRHDHYIALLGSWHAYQMIKKPPESGRTAMVTENRPFTIFFASRAASSERVLWQCKALEPADIGLVIARERPEACLRQHLWMPGPRPHVSRAI
eukprot:3865750-Amphidinium_carterae.1